MKNLVAASKWALGKCEHAARRSLKSSALFIIWLYRFHLSGSLGGSCRFEPSCSVYAEHCLHEHPPGQALLLITKRLLRCRPFGPFGFDPAPKRIKRHGSAT